MQVVQGKTKREMWCEKGGSVSIRWGCKQMDTQP
jgi:hypothetical protein